MKFITVNQVILGMFLGSMMAQAAAIPYRASQERGALEARRAPEQNRAMPKRAPVVRAAEKKRPANKMVRRSNRDDKKDNDKKDSKSHDKKDNKSKQSGSKEHKDSSKGQDKHAKADLKTDPVLDCPEPYTGTNPPGGSDHGGSGLSLIHI